MVHVCRTRPELASRLEQNSDLYLGTVKWFDPKRSYGFIVAEEGGHDVFFHARNVYADNPAALEPIKGGLEVEYTLLDEHVNSKGDSDSQLKAARVTLPGGASFRTHSHAQVAVGMFEPYDRLRAVVTNNPIDPTVRAGTVKWFSTQKKYGFLVSPAFPDQQIYVALHAIQPAGFDHLVEDQPVEFLVETRADGSLRAVGVTGPNSQLGPLYGGHAGAQQPDYASASMAMYLGYPFPYAFPAHANYPAGSYYVAASGQPVQGLPQPQPGQPPLQQQPAPAAYGKQSRHPHRKRKGDGEQAKRQSQYQHQHPHYVHAVPQPQHVQHQHPHQHQQPMHPHPHPHAHAHAHAHAQVPVPVQGQQQPQPQPQFQHQH
jgi:cold shock CspA family protein